MNEFSEYIFNYETLSESDQKLARLSMFPNTYSIHKEARYRLTSIDELFLFKSYWGTNISPSIDLETNNRDMHELEDYYANISKNDFIFSVIESELLRVLQRYHSN
jgi:hypothetical protein